ncbi:MAG: hypothetical protein HOP12_07115 [Candidatus Eisenbacteria bacterium]|uniref:Dockerin domain-containing protein n=1 Tax=Eiseniibacteriota bacterium TaxID=2212470 RepID=A0A849SMU0_UNCEI|nr:hypothetical protein [Candidatus Eisenbacteria bacterium]
MHARRLIPAVLIAALVTLLASLATPVGAQVVQINSSIASNTTWGPTGTVVGTVFWVRSNIAVNAGVTLIIQPGVVVKFDPSRLMTVNGSLRAIGTGAQYVFFTSSRDDNLAGDTNGDGTATQPAAQDWGGVQFTDASPDFGSRLDFCDLRFGGSGSGGILIFTSASDTVSNSFVRRGYYGVDCAGSAAPVLLNTSIEASTQTPIVLDFTAAPVLSSLVFSSANNGYDAFGLRGGFLSGTATLPRRGATVGANPITNVTYVLLGSLTINVGASLTINPGVVIKPLGGYSITANGSLSMNGTAAAGDTIVMTSINDDNFGNPPDTNNNGSITAPNRGDWNRIVFSSTGSGSISRVRLRFGTNSNQQGMIETSNVTIPVSNSILSEASHGLAIFGVATPSISNLAINNCSSTPILMSVSANPTFTNITFLANAVTALGIQGENVAADSRLALRNIAGFTNITYYLMNGQLHMLSPNVLRIDPGVVVKNQLSGGGMLIDGALIADGKPESLIVITSERDDLFGNPPDTNGDGAITAPGVANWGYVRLTPTSNDATSVIDQCRITYGSYDPGNTWPSSVWLTSAAAPISNCFISRSGYGVRFDGDSNGPISNCDINNCTSAPIVMSAGSNPNIATSNVYSTNGFNALGLLSETLSGNARLRYRPGVGTPTFAYLPTGVITVPAGVTLTVEPQVVLKSSSSFTVFDVSGALNMVGSNGTTGRIVFTSRRDDNPIYGGDTTPNDASTPQVGDWGQIKFEDSAVDAECIVRNVLFQFGGSSNTFGTIETSSASPRLARLEFFQNGTAFTIGGASAPGIDSTNVLNCTQLPIAASLVSNPTFANITFANNQFLAYGILGETIAQDVRTRVRSIGGYPNLNYALAGNVSIAFGARWTIDPGVVLKLGRFFTSDPIGTGITIDGTLVADGKPDSLIVFTSSADDAFGQDVKGDGAATLAQPGQWQGINFTGVSNDVLSVIDHCLFRYGSFSTGMLDFVNAGQTVTNTRLTLGSTSPVVIEGSSTPTFVNCFFDSTSTGAPVAMSLVSEPVFTNVQFLKNQLTALSVIGENIAQDVLWKVRAVSGRNNMPYYLNSTVTIGLGATLTMQPGVIVKMQSSGGITVQRAIQALGRTDPESLIVFTSLRDDFYGGDTNNDSSATVPAASSWNYVQIDGTAIDPQCVFRNCVFRYGQYGVRCVNSAPTIDSCLVNFNQNGINVEGASNPLVRGCTIFGNSTLGINNVGASFCVSAEGCWWGAASGPADASATADLCAIGTNAGTGDAVTNNVDYLPFATTGILNPLIGDVSLNGRVLAFDASLVLQYLVASISLNPLQLLVADVTGTASVSALDASLILQYVAGVISGFPVNSNLEHHRDPRGSSALLARLQGRFELELGEAIRDGAEWRVPLQVNGDAPVLGVELMLSGSAASDFLGVEAASGVESATRSADGTLRLALASLTSMPGEPAWLRFAAHGDRFDPPRRSFARVNEQTLDSPPLPILPARTAFARPAPNPAHGSAQLSLAIGAQDADGAVELRVLDVAGRTVRTLVRGTLAPGLHRFTWDLTDDRGGRVRPALYFVRARTRTLDATHRLIVVR